MMMTTSKVVKHTGGCHCGAVRYEVMAATTVQVNECNCSICTKKQNRHFTVPASQFKLLKGHDSLTTYTFNTHQAKHNFCKTCGVQSFYIPNSNPDVIGVMPHCLDEGTIEKLVSVNGKTIKGSKSTTKTVSLKKRSKGGTQVDVMY